VRYLVKINQDVQQLESLLLKKRILIVTITELELFVEMLEIPVVFYHAMVKQCHFHTIINLQINVCFLFFIFCF